MIKRTITYQDLDGNEIVEEFYFHLSRAELFETEMVDSYSTMLAKLIAEKDARKSMDAFKNLIASTVGKRSEDGKSFLKTQEIRDAFMGSEAWGILFFDLMSSPQVMADFMMGIVPKDLADKSRGDIDKRVAELTQGIEAPIHTTVQADHAEPARPSPLVPDDKRLEDYSQKQLVEMPYAEFQALIDEIPFKNIPVPVRALAMQRRVEERQAKADAAKLLNEVDANTPE